MASLCAASTFIEMKACKPDLQFSFSGMGWTKRIGQECHDFIPQYTSVSISCLSRNRRTASLLPTELARPACSRFP